MFIFLIKRSEKRKNSWKLSAFEKFLRLGNHEIQVLRWGERGVEVIVRFSTSEMISGIWFAGKIYFECFRRELTTVWRIK